MGQGEDQGFFQLRRQQVRSQTPASLSTRYEVRVPSAEYQVPADSRVLCLWRLHLRTSRARGLVAPHYLPHVVATFPDLLVEVAPLRLKGKLYVHTQLQKRGGEAHQ